MHAVTAKCKLGFWPVNLVSSKLQVSVSRRNRRKGEESKGKGKEKKKGGKEVAHRQAFYSVTLFLQLCTLFTKEKKPGYCNIRRVLFRGKDEYYSSNIVLFASVSLLSLMLFFALYSIRL